MKHVSRVLFGFSIVAVLALFTACPQASDPKKAGGGSSSAELTLTDENITAALTADITSGVDFSKSPVEVNTNLSISKKLTIGTEENVEVAVAVAKQAGGEVTGLNVDATTSTDKIAVTVPVASSVSADKNILSDCTYTEIVYAAMFMAVSIGLRATSLYVMPTQREGMCNPIFIRKFIINLHTVFCDALYRIKPAQKIMNPPIPNTRQRIRTVLLSYSALS